MSAVGGAGASSFAAAGASGSTAAFSDGSSLPGSTSGRPKRASSTGRSASVAQNTAGLSRMERMEPARMRSRASGSRMPSPTPSVARMKENSPICARLAEIVSAVPTGRRKAMTMRKARIDLPMRMMNSVARIGSGSRQMLEGSKSMPTETKNSTAKASRSGSVSCAARWLSSLSDRIMPAKKAPSAS